MAHPAGPARGGSLSWLKGDTALQRVQCLLNCHQWGCEMPALWHTNVGKEVLNSIEARAIAVLTCFYLAGKGVSIATYDAHAGMQELPRELIQGILSEAGLRVPTQSREAMLAFERTRGNSLGRLWVSCTVVQ